MENQIDRINALTSNARNTWFVLLGALIFVGLTLMQVDAIDFYGVDRATQLPLVNVSVPTRLFFYAAPFLVAAVYGYFHLYLIRLWDALGPAPYQNDFAEPLSDLIQPWLVSDAAFDRQSDWRNVFLDASVEVPPELRQWMGDPCQWRWAETYRDDNGPLSDAEFFGMWRGWLERAQDQLITWEQYAPDRWREVPAIAPPSECTWAE